MKALKITCSLVILISILVFTNCKKEKSTSDPAPTNSGSGSGTAVTNTVTWFVSAYDSVGDLLADRSNINVSFLNTTFSAVTNSLGSVSMTNVPAGNLYPALTKPNYEYAPSVVNYNATLPLSLNKVIARNSPYKLTLTNYSLVNKDSIRLNFFLNKLIPAGKSIKIAILASDIASIDVNNFKAYDYLTVSGSNTNFSNKNIAKLNNIDVYLAGLNTGQTCYFVIVPVTYGVAYSNSLSKNVLLGDNLPIVGSPTATMQITKNW
jgi:hypothetical protein